MPTIDGLDIQLIGFRFDDPTIKLRSNDCELYYFEPGEDVSWQIQRDIKIQITHCSREKTEATYLLTDNNGELHCLWIKLICINYHCHVPITIEMIDTHTYTEGQESPDLHRDYIIEINGKSIYEFLERMRDIPAVDSFLNSGLVNCSKRTSRLNY